MRLLLGLFVLAFWIAPAMRAQDGTATAEISWRKSLAEALKEAAEKKKPILVAFNMDGERANDEMARNHYHDAEIVRKSADFVCLIGSKYEHTTDPNAVCPRFGGITCAQHIAIEKECREKWLESSTVNSPQHLFVLPDGTLHFAKVWLMSKKEMSELMQDERKKMFPDRYPDAAAKADGAASRPAAENPASAPAAAPAAGNVKKEPKTPSELKDAILASEDTWTVKGYARTLLRMDDPEAKKIPQELLKDEKQSEKRRFGLILAYGFKGHKEALPMLEKMLLDKAKDIRHHALIAVEDIGEKSSVKALKKMLETEEEDRIRKDIARALGVCGAGDPAIATMLMKLNGDKAGLVQRNAILALGNFKGNAEVEKSLMITMQGSGGRGGGRGGGGWMAGRQKMEAAAFALGQMKSKKAKEEVEKRLEKSDNEMMQGILEGVLKLFDQDFDHPSEELYRQRQRIGGDKIRRDLEPEIKSQGGMFGGEDGGDAGGGDGGDGGDPGDGGGNRPPRPNRPGRPGRGGN